jgi:sigma-E factor negative regulatory protein RseA
MSDQIREELSALVDDELPSSRAGVLFDRLRSDEALRREWRRYHEIGDLIRGEAIDLSMNGLADRVRQQLQDEPAIIASPRRPPVGTARLGWGQAAVGIALAASVAGVSVYLAPLLSGPDLGQSAAIAQGIAPGPAAQPPAPQTVAEAPLPQGLMQVAQTPINAEPPPAPDQRWKRLAQANDSGKESKLNRYLVDHSAYSAPAGIASILPYATFVSHDPSR